MLAAASPVTVLCGVLHPSQGDPLNYYRRFPEDAYYEDLFGALTGYRLFVISSLVPYVLCKTVQLVFRIHAVEPLVESGVVAISGLSLYCLGVYANTADPPYRPEFFHEDYSKQAKPYLRPIIIFFTVFLICLWMSSLPMLVATWGAALRYFSRTYMYTFGTDRRSIRLVHSCLDVGSGCCSFALFVIWFVRDLTPLWQQALRSFTLSPTE